MRDIMTKLDLDFVDNNFATICLFGLTCVAVASYMNKSGSKKTREARSVLTRGPKTLPFFGNSLWLKKDDGLLEQLSGLWKDYGPVCPIYMGRKPIVVVNGLAAIREAVVKNGFDFGDRAETVPYIQINPNRLGIYDTRADESWKHQRRFAHTTLRGMGFGKVSLEPVIMGEVNGAIDFFKYQQGSFFNPRAGFAVSSFNVISQLLFNQRIEHGIESASELNKNVRDVMLYNPGTLVHLLPIAWHLVRRQEKWRNGGKAWKNLQAFFDKEIRIRQERIDSAEGEPEISDFVEAYLVHRKTDPDNYSLEALHFSLFNLYLAGTDTTSTTMTWAIIFLVTNPDVQQKIHNEIIKEVGTEQVSMSDRSKLPYTQATLLEVQRLASVTPVVFRRASKDATLGGLTVPEGTDVYINLWSLHHDPEVFPDPMTFNPNRFLETDGALKQPENFMPFSAGKRNCMGEQLAKMELFLFFASLVQRLKFSIPPGQEAPSYEGMFDIVRSPKDFEVQVSAW